MWATVDTSLPPDMTWEPADGVKVQLDDKVYLKLVALFNNGGFTGCYFQGHEGNVYAFPGDQWNDLRGSSQYDTTDIGVCPSITG